MPKQKRYDFRAAAASETSKRYVCRLKKGTWPTVAAKRRAKRDQLLERTNSHTATNAVRSRLYPFYRSRVGACREQTARRYVQKSLAEHCRPFSIPPKRHPRRVQAQTIAGARRDRQQRNHPHCGDRTTNKHTMGDAQRDEPTDEEPRRRRDRGSTPDQASYRPINTTTLFSLYTRSSPTSLWCPTSDRGNTRSTLTGGGRDGQM